MSIVYDYLKQIQEKKEPVKAAPSKGPPSNIFLSRWAKIVFVFLACVGAGLAVYFLAPRAVKPIVKLYHAPVDVSADVPVMRSTEPSYLLEGIIYNPSQPFAIINGKMLEKKGRIGDFEVTEITPDSVALRNTKDNTSRTIHL